MLRCNTSLKNVMSQRIKNIAEQCRVTCRVVTVDPDKYVIQNDICTRGYTGCNHNEPCLLIVELYCAEKRIEKFEIDRTRHRRDDPDRVIVFDRCKYADDLRSQCHNADAGEAYQRDYDLRISPDSRTFSVLYAFVHIRCERTVYRSDNNLHDRGDIVCD